MNIIQPERAHVEPADIGKLGMDDRNGQVYICCSNFGFPQWMPLNTLSARNWMTMRQTVATSLEKEKRETMEIEKKHQDNIRKMSRATCDKTREMLISLFKKMGDAEKGAFLKTHSTSWLATTATCTACLKICDEKHKCIHFGCSGMCKSCHDTLTKEGDKSKCPACGKLQRITCPICQEDKDTEQLVMADGGCGHGVCWKCFGRAYKAGLPIVSCPLCRGPFMDNDDEKDDESVLTDSDDDLDLEFDASDDTVLQSPIIDIMQAQPIPGLATGANPAQVTALLEFIHSASVLELDTELDVRNQEAIEMLNEILHE